MKPLSYFRPMALMIEVEDISKRDLNAKRYLQSIKCGSGLEDFSPTFLTDQTRLHEKLLIPKTKPFSVLLFRRDKYHICKTDFKVL